jgi:hypothetical protein
MIGDDGMRVKIRSRRRRNPHTRTFQARIANAVSGYIADKTYDCTNLPGLRKALLALSNDEKFWSGLKKLQLATKDINEFMERYFG